MKDGSERLRIHRYSAIFAHWRDRPKEAAPSRQEGRRFSPVAAKAEKALICLGILLSLSKLLYALDSIQVSTLVDRLDITSRLEVLRDSGARLSFDQILASYPRFAVRPKGAYDFGYTSDAIWARFGLTNGGREPVELFLENDYPPTNRVELFSRVSGREWTRRVLGNQTPFPNRVVIARNPVFVLRLDPGQEGSYYARISSSGTLDVRLLLWTPSAFNAHERDMQLIYGLFFGIILIMGIYNLLLYIYVPGPAYLAYFAFTLCFSFFVATIRGFSFEYVFPSLPAFNTVAMPISIALSDLTAALFTRAFLSTRRDFRFLDKVLIAFIAGALIAVALSFLLPYSIITPAAAFLTFPLTAIFLFTGIASLSRGNRVARFYTLAWGVFLAGVFLTAMHAFGIMQTSFLTSYGLELGATAQVVLLSFSLADKFYLTHKEVELFQEKNAQANRLETLGILTAQIGHEINAPNHVIALNASLLDALHRRVQEDRERAREDGLCEPPEEAATLNEAEPLVKAILKATGQINQVSTNLRSEVRTQEPPARVDLSQVLRQTAQLYEVRWRQETNRLSIRYPESPALIYGVEFRLQQLIVNLVNNALNSLVNRDKAVLLSVEIGETEIVLTVTDEGQGMSPEAQARLGTPFFTTRMSQDGTGFGWSLCQEIVKQHRGRLELESSPGSGTRVKVRFPDASAFGSGPGD